MGKQLKPPTRWLAGGSILLSLGGIAAGMLFKKERQKWEKLEPILDSVTAYELGRGGGQLIRDWLQHQHPHWVFGAHAKRLHQLLKQTDRNDTNPMEQACTRFVVSKALFYLEGFKVSGCQYEEVQLEAWQRLKPYVPRLTRYQVFQGEPFEPAEIIGTTHRLLLLLAATEAEQANLRAFLHDYALQSQGRDAVDYFARLMAMTFEVSSEKRLQKLIGIWFEDYQAFRLSQTEKHQTLIKNSLAIAGGGLPDMLKQELVKNLIRRFKGKA